MLDWHPHLQLQVTAARHAGVQVRVIRCTQQDPAPGLLVAPDCLGDDVLDALAADVLWAVGAGVGSLIGEFLRDWIGPIAEPFFQGYRTGYVLTDALNCKFYSRQKALA